MTDINDLRIVAPTPVKGGPLETAYLIAERRAIKKAFTSCCEDSGWFILRGTWTRCRRCRRGTVAA